MSEAQKGIILFDLDDTILDFRTAERRAIKTTFEEMGIDSSDDTLRRYSEINMSCWHKLEKGEMTRGEVLISRFEMLFAEMGVEQSACDAQHRYEQLLGGGHYFVPGAPELLEELDEKYDLYIISNGVAATQAKRIESAGIAKYFKDIFISELIGFNKPSREFFEVCFSRIPGFARPRALIVGDSLSADIRGGQNAQVATCWLNMYGEEPGEIRPDHTIRSLSELPALVEKIFA